MVQVKWCDIKGGDFIVRKFTGELVYEDEKAITFIYRGKPLTLSRENCFIYEV